MTFQECQCIDFGSSWLAGENGRSQGREKYLESYGIFVGLREFQVIMEFKLFSRVTIGEYYVAFLNSMFKHSVYPRLQKPWKTFWSYPRDIFM